MGGLFQARGRARGKHEELPIPREVRVAEHWSGDIILAMARMLLGDTARQDRADRTRGNMSSPRGENVHQPRRPERDRGKRVIVGQGGKHHIAGGKIAQPRGSAGAARPQCRCPLRVSVKNHHLIAVFDKIDGKSVSHMAETDHTDMIDDQFIGSLLVSQRFTSLGRIYCAMAVVGVDKGGSRYFLDGKKGKRKPRPIPRIKSESGAICSRRPWSSAAVRLRRSRFSLICARAA